MKKIILFAFISVYSNHLPAQSDTANKNLQLQKLKQARDKINNEVRDLEEEVAKQKQEPAGRVTDGNVSFSGERPMQVVTAKLLDKRTGAPASGIRCYLSVPGVSFELRTAVSEHDGTIRFFVQHVYPSKPMIFQTDQRSDSMYRFEVGDPFTQKRFSRENASDSLAFFGNPDKRYMLDDYTRFPTMEEVLIEYVPEVRIKKNRGHFSMQVLNIPYKTFFEQEPMVLIDGVPVFNLDALIATDPLKIKKLEVMGRRYYYGSLSWDGVVSFTTYDGDLAGYSLYDNAVVKEFKK